MLFECKRPEKYLSSSVISSDDQQKLLQSITANTKRNLATAPK